MEARLDEIEKEKEKEKVEIEKRNLSPKLLKLLAKLRSPEQRKIMQQFSADAVGLLDEIYLSLLEANGEKHLRLLVILMLNDLDLTQDQPLIDPYSPFMLSNNEAIMLKGFEIAQASGKATLTSNLLQMCAIAANPQNFKMICDLLNLPIRGEEYTSIMTRKNPQLLLPIAPLYVAAYSGNRNLLRDMCSNISKDTITALEEHTGLSLMHFAAMGSDEETIEYLSHQFPALLTTPSRMGITPFSYTALSNNLDAIQKFLDLGFKPNIKDITYFNALFRNNDITVLRKYLEENAGGIPTYDMPTLLTEMLDPNLRAIKTARYRITELLTNTLSLLEDMIHPVRNGHAERAEVLPLIEAIIAPVREEISTYFHLTNKNKSFAEFYQESLLKLEYKKNSLKTTGEIMEEQGYGVLSSNFRVSDYDLQRASLAHSRTIHSSRSSSPPPSRVVQSSAPQSSSTEKMMREIDREWEERVRENISRTLAEEEKKEKQPSVPTLSVESDHEVDMSELEFADFTLDADTYGSDYNEDEREEKEEKTSPRL